jgi:hypothetical protein
MMFLCACTIYGQDGKIMNSDRLYLLSPPETVNPFPDEAFHPLSLPDTTITQNAATTADEDTSEVSDKPKLLPDKMSFGETFFWGEHGLWRRLGISSELSPEVRKHELGLRRTMLTIHQISGFATVALMWTTAYYGQQVINGHTNLGNTKSNLATATILAYSFTALMSLLSPPPLIRRDEEGTIGTHKLLAWIHVAGMIITPILANNIKERIPGTHQSFLNLDRAHVHQVAGYITTAVFTAAMITVTF